jgi:hypothetical protein
MSNAILSCPLDYFLFVVFFVFFLLYCVQSVRCKMQGTKTISRSLLKVHQKCILHIIYILFIFQQSPQPLPQKRHYTPVPP